MLMVPQIADADNSPVHGSHTLEKIECAAYE